MSDTKPYVQMPNVKTGIEIIAEERQRQIYVEKWDYSHDIDYKDNQLVRAAMCYAANAINKSKGEGIALALIKNVRMEDCMVTNVETGIEQYAGIAQEVTTWDDAWPWDEEWDKREKHDEMRSLVIAGALIAAEIDRLLLLNPEVIEP